MGEWTVGIEDVTPFVAAQRANASNALGDLVIPLEQVFVPRDPETAQRLGIDADEIDGGHYVSLSRPQELADRLVAYTAGTQ